MSVVEVDHTIAAPLAPDHVRSGVTGGLDPYPANKWNIIGRAETLARSLKFN